LAIIGKEDNRVTGSDFPAIEIYYYSTTGKDQHEITPIPLHRRYKAGGFYGGMGGRGSIDMNNAYERACMYSNIKPKNVICGEGQQRDLV
jgi:hypothetical protein